MEGGRHQVPVPEDLVRDLADALERLPTPRSGLTLDRAFIGVLAVVLGILGVLLTRVLDRVDSTATLLSVTREELVARPSRSEIDLKVESMCRTVREGMQIQIDGISEREKLHASEIEALRNGDVHSPHMRH